MFPRILFPIGFKLRIATVEICVKSGSRSEVAAFHTALTHCHWLAGLLAGEGRDGHGSPEPHRVSTLSFWACVCSSWAQGTGFFYRHRFQFTHPGSNMSLPPFPAVLICSPLSPADQQQLQAHHWESQHPLQISSSAPLKVPAQGFSLLLCPCSARLCIPSSPHKSIRSDSYSSPLFQILHNGSASLFTS